MRSRPLLLAAAIATALCAAPTAFADWKKDYDRGLKAMDDGQWAAAEASFRAALADDGEPNAKKRFQGVVVKPYVPHHYAGVAAWRQGDCNAALEYFRHGPTSSVVATLPELQSVRTKATGECTAKLAAASKPTVPVAATTAPPAAQPAQTQAPPVATPSRPVASPPVAAAAKPEAKPVTPPASPPPATPASAPAPAPLVAAVEAYLSGRYAAVTQLDPATLADGRAKAQGFLLRAASRYTLAQLADGDAAQLEQARRDVRAARGANAALSPDEAAFSPRFRAFWRETR